VKKLDEIPKNHPFEVPDGYFERLPGIIQSRITAPSPVEKRTPVLRYALQFAVPVVLVLVAALYFLKPSQHADASTILASVSTEELFAYLEESEISTDDLLNEALLDAEGIEALESEVYFNFDLDSLDDLTLEIDNLEL
jgi:hypothetical protein